MIEVIRCGPMSTVQDLGRFGHRHLGVAQSGALDPIAVQQGNLLLGNEAGAAVLESSVGPLQLQFHQNCRIVLMGVDFDSVLTSEDDSSREQSVQSGHPVEIRAGMLLHLRKPAIAGARAYLVVSGGIDVPLVLGSRSTDLAAGFGGLHGRPLQSGDSLPIGRFCTPPEHRPYGVRSLAPSHVLRALPGPDYETFTPQAHQQFWMQPWRISHQSNRMGLRLNGNPLTLQEPLGLLSAGVLPGDVQVPGNGLPIVLANDAQTIGGYPRIASVIQADLWQLAHMPPLTSVYFQPVTQAVALAAREKQSRYLARLRDALASAN